MSLRQKLQYSKPETNSSMFVTYITGQYSHKMVTNNDNVNDDDDDDDGTTYPVTMNSAKEACSACVCVCV
jgi:hypothetical protein